MIDLTVSADAAGQRLDKFVRRALRDVPLSHVYKMLRTRKVRVNGGRGRAEQLLAEGDRVVIRGDEERLLAPAETARPRPARPTFRVLYEDEHVLAVDKPAGLAAHPGSGIEGATLVDEVRAHLAVPEDLPPGEFRPSPAHRLDRETSGVVVVAKTRRAMVALGELFSAGDRVSKTYLALVKGKMPRPSGTIDLPLSEHEQTARSRERRGVNFQEAVTRWQATSSNRDASLLAVRIETGRTHQIRRHLEAAGHPVAGDRRYGDFAFNRSARTRWGLRRMFLHALRLSLPHPVTGARLDLLAPLPDDLAEVLSRANLQAPGQGAPASPPPLRPRPGAR
ncbi:MAG TPA: RluA family pseudouridine synthase [Anaeromyxobacteraceae bacterium]|nr:RluA family pseudouridine synthase [Anaeromyxobacteraceae bacterium]